MAAHALFGNLTQGRAFDRRCGAREIFLNELRRKAHRIENLGAAIGLIGGDAHLGHHLQNAFADGLDVILLHLIGTQRQEVIRPNLLQRFEGEIGIDAFRAVPCQRAEVMHFARFACFHDEPGLHP